MQKMVIAKKGLRWYLRYRTAELVPNRKGEQVRREVWEPIAAVDERYKTKRDVEGLARDIFNRKALGLDKPGASQRLADYIKNKYFPGIEPKYDGNQIISGDIAPSTFNGYKKLFSGYLETRLGDIRLFDFDAPTAQRILDEIATTETNPDGDKLSKGTLAHIKHFMSGVITFAIRKGDLKSEHNPIRLVAIPKGGAKKKTIAYDLAEIAKMMEVLPETASTVVAVAAFTGLRKGEIRGLKWQDLDTTDPNDPKIHIRQTVWRTIEKGTKTAASEAPVPMVPMVHDLLEAHRNGFKPGDYIFIGEKFGRSLNFDNLARRVVMPKLKEANIQWAGWHGFRRGLATNLYALGIKEELIRDICRHADIKVTREHYIKPSTAQAQPAMKKLVKVFKKTQEQAAKQAEKTARDLREKMRETASRKSA
jgi:integrase